MSATTLFFVFFLGTYFIHLKRDPPKKEDIMETLNQLVAEAYGGSTCVPLGAFLSSSACMESAAECIARNDRLKTAYEGACTKVPETFDSCLSPQFKECLVTSWDCKSFRSDVLACFENKMTAALLALDSTLVQDMGSPGSNSTHIRR